MCGFSFIDGEAARAFVESGNCYNQMGSDSKHDAATQWVAASQMFKKAEPPSTEWSALPAHYWFLILVCAKTNRHGGLGQVHEARHPKLH